MFTANEDGKGHKNITEPSVTFTVTQSKSSSPPPSPPPSPLPPPSLPTLSKLVSYVIWYTIWETRSLITLYNLKYCCGLQETNFQSLSFAPYISLARSTSRFPWSPDQIHVQQGIPLVDQKPRSKCKTFLAVKYQRQQRCTLGLLYRFWLPFIKTYYTTLGFKFRLKWNKQYIQTRTW